jgi:murein DD-endopeptidase MepM/ murein hydrolase activator NlpD
MPALTARPGRLSGVGVRVVGAGLLALMLLAVELAPGEPVAARDWSPWIASLRSSQLYYEAAMRSADRQVRATKHGIRRARKALTRARRAVSRRRERLELAKEKLQRVRLAHAAARQALAQASVAPPTLVELREALLFVAVPPLPAVRSAVAPIAPAIAADPIADIDSERLASEATAYVDAIIEARELAADRARELRQQERRVDRARHRLGRASRNQRQGTRRVAALRRARRAAIARREGAEAALGNAILAMSRYAQRRIAKKTDVRPGVTSGFIWPTRGRLSQGYGRHHDGIDIAGYRGTPVRAAAVGVISYVGWNPWDQHGRAFMVVVAHPGGFETLYGHTLPTRAVRVGEVVRKGEVIGYMGNTGNSTGVHLHLELRRGRVTLNPLAFL